MFVSSSIYCPLSDGDVAMHVADDLFAIGKRIPIGDDLVVDGEDAAEGSDEKEGGEEELFHFGKRGTVSRKQGTPLHR